MEGAFSFVFIEQLSAAAAAEHSVKPHWLQPDFQRNF